MGKPENHAIQNAQGWGATIIQMVGAMECDYDRLGELRNERIELVEAIDCEPNNGEGYKQAQEALANWDEEHKQELDELEALASVDGELFDSDDAVRDRIMESPLSVQVRSGWADPGAEMVAEEFEILLTTGGPALRIRGELDEHKQPYRAWLEYQDWGTPWTEFHGEGAPRQETLVTFCSVFYFGE